jgi:hypothetical protein
VKANSTRGWNRDHLMEASLIYVLPIDPSSPPISLTCLRARAKRVGFCIARDRYSDTFSLIDARTGLPLIGLDHVGLPAIANAVEAVRSKYPNSRNSGICRRTVPVIDELIRTIREEE